MKALSASEQDVQNAINAVANAGGGVVEMPGESVEYKIGVDVHQGVSLIGNGETHIVDSVPKDGTVDLEATQALRINFKAGFELAGFTIEGNTPDVMGMNKGHIRMAGYAPDVHVHHLKTMNNQCTVVRTLGECYGLFDHIDFTTNLVNQMFILIDHGGSFGDASGYGDKSWCNPIEWGSFKALYIQDSSFTNTRRDYVSACIDNFVGARCVFRRNKLLGATLGSHGTETGQRYRGMRYYEIYDNTFEYYYIDPEHPETVGVDGVIWIRSGTAVVFRNKVIGAYRLLGFNTFIKTTLKRDTGGYPPWGQCDGTSPYDQNAEPGGYRCVDQIGAGTSRDLGGLAIPEPRWVENQIDAVYEWENELSDEPTWGRIGAGAHVTEGRDYFLNTKRPDYVEAGPHPLESGEPGPEPVPPNQSPVIESLAVLHGNNPIDPAEPITHKFVTLSLVAKDDIGVAYLELAVNGQIVKADPSPDANPTTLTFKLNTQPYKRKGGFLVSALVRDGEGASVSQSRLYKVANN